MAFKVQVGPPQVAIHQAMTVLVTEPDGQVGWPTDKGLYFPGANCRIKGVRHTPSKSIATCPLMKGSCGDARLPKELVKRRTFSNPYCWEKSVTQR